MSRYSYGSVEFEVDRWSEASVLIRDVIRNRDALHEFARRLETRFGAHLMFASDGLPHPIRTVVNIGTQGPYWCYYRFLTTEAQRRSIPDAIQEEGRALISQGVRIRKQLEGAFPEIPKNLLFPLNLKEA